MSRSVDLFIDVAVPIEELAAKLGDLAGVTLTRVADAADDAEGGEHWVLEDGSVRAVLAAHPYVDDGELVFSHYRYALSARVANSARPQDAPETFLLRRLADKVLHGAGLPALLVLDLQYRDRGQVAGPNGSGAEFGATAEPDGRPETGAAPERGGAA